MPKTAIVTDSNSGISQKQADELGIFVVPMPFFINGDTFFEDINLSVPEFYEKLAAGAQISTSQPSLEELSGLWDNLLIDYDEIVHIPMSSGLSGSCQSAHMLSLEYDGKVQVVDNQRISVTQLQSVLDALYLVNQGKDACHIKQALEDDKLNSTIYIMLDTLSYLKKGGRITPAAAALGTLLKIKPVLQIQGEKLDAFAKARTTTQGKNLMITAIQNDINNRFHGKATIYIAHTENEAAAYGLRDELLKLYPDQSIPVYPLSLSVACHIGPGSLAIAATGALEDN